MSATINHFITWIINPYSLGFMGLVIGGLWLVAGRKVAGAKGLLGLSIAWLWFWSTGFAANGLGSSLEDRYPQKTVESYPTADVIHILGGGMGVNTNDCLYAEMNGNADRVWMGARLWRELRSRRSEVGSAGPLLVCSGGLVRESTLPLLADLGVDTNRVVLLDEAKNTEDEARLLGELVVSRQLLVASNRTELTTNDYQLTTSKPRVLLVTSAWHMRRAELLFGRNSAYEIIPAPCDYEATTRFGASHAWELSDFVPSPDAIGLSCFFFKEHFAYWCYRVKFWVRGK